MSDTSFASASSRAAPSALHRSILLIFVLAASGCGSVDEDYRSPDSESESIDGELLDIAYAQASRIRNIKSLLVWRNGEMVAERYFRGSEPGELHDVRSVTKSVLSALVGIAIEQGFLGGIDDTLGDHIEAVSAHLDPAKGRVTMGNLLTMTAGHEWQELGGRSEFRSWVSSPDQIDYVLKKPLLYTPGSRFCYSDGSAHLVSVMLTEATGMGMDELARQQLFAPLGIGSRPWLTDKRGYSYGGVGLHLSARDMVKIGVLYLQRGVYDGEQIVPADWIDASTRAQVSTHDAVPYLREYGYFWWLGQTESHQFYCANGYGGQFIVTVPDLNLVAVATSRWRGLRGQAGHQWYEILTVILRHVLPAVRPISATNPG